MHETVALDVASWSLRDGPCWMLDPKVNYPVSLCEPPVVLYLSSTFEKHSWIIDAFRTACNSSSRIHTRRDRSFRFSEAKLHCNQPWGSRKVTLVALKRTPDSEMQICPVSWNSSSSDHWSYKVTSPQIPQ